MAGQTRRVNFDPAAAADPWPTVRELITALPAQGWLLVGGLMVRLHEIAAGVTPSRATRDIDIVVDVEAAATSYLLVAGAIQRLHFTPRDPGGPHTPFSRFEDGDRRIDTMVSEHLPPARRPRYRLRPVFAADGAAQALRRRDHFAVGPDGDLLIPVPDHLGALIAKSAAHLADPHDKERHLTDLAVLLACVPGPIPDGLGELTRNDRRRLRHITDTLEPASPAWDTLPQADATRGQHVLDRIARFLRQ